MRDALTARGVPASDLPRLCGLSHRDLDRPGDIYQQRRLIVVSQRDCLNAPSPRLPHGVEAWGYDAVGSGPSCW
jgi:hypothetical protein